MKKLLTLALTAICFSGIYALTTGGNHDRPSVADMLREQVDSGSAEAMYRLAEAMETGRYGVEKDTTEALRLLRRSAEAGFSPAMNYLGYAHAFSLLGLEQNPDSALLWIERAAMSPEPDPKAFNNLGMMLLTGANGISRDYGKARYWLERGHEHQNPFATAMLARIYLEGLGVEPDTVQALTLLRLAASKGLRDASYKLADLVLPSTESLSAEEALEMAMPYYNDHIFTVAIPLITRAADANVPFALAVLAQCKAEGIGTPYNFLEAVELYAKAAILGEPHAQFILAETLQEFPDMLRALPDLDCTLDAGDLYESAAVQGITDATAAIAPLRP